MDCRILSSAFIVATLLTCGCLAPFGPGPGSPMPPGAGHERATAVALPLAINATPTRYNPAMSSTIGIRLTPENVTGIPPEDVRFTWETSFGSFYHWGPPDFKVIELGSTYTGTSDPVYWAYVPESGGKEKRPVDITLTMTDARTGMTITWATLKIGWEEPGGLTAIVEGSD